MYNKQYQEQLEALSGIRNLMERSSRYLPLSGKAGVAIGVLSLICSLIVDAYFRIHEDNLKHLSLLFGTLFVICLVIEILMADRNSRQKGVPAWDAIAKRFLINLFIPMFVGGIYCFALIQQHQLLLVLPATLIFYGLALINASRYTMEDIRYLGFAELILGLVASFFPEYGLIAWAIGFGVLHVLYGAIIYFKYEK
jgi:hypothetical protein